MPPLQSASLFQDLERLEALAFAPVVNAEKLAASLQKIYQAAATANFSNYDIAAVRKSAPELMYRVFDLRVGLRERITEYESRGLMTPDVVQALRDVFRILRYVTDMLGEIAIGHARIGDGQPGSVGFKRSEERRVGKEC